MAVLRKPRTLAAVGLLCIAAGAAAFGFSHGIVGGGPRPAPPPPERADGSIQLPADAVSDAGQRVVQPPVIDVGTTTPRHRRSNYLVITSDPQYPWTPEMDGHKVQCGEERACSRALIQSQYDSINRLVRTGHLVLGTFINGDLTAFGHDWQIQYMKSAIGSIRTPVYLGLGNHDYENNVDDCWENSCVRSSVQWFRDHMAKLPLDAFDVRDNRYYSFPWNRRDTHGSLGWTKRFGDITVIQVNNYPEYEAYAQGLEVRRAGRAVTHIQEQVFINDGMRWLDQQLRRERAAGQAIIVMSHIGWGSEAFTGLLNHYEVSALFAGHIHDWVGPAPDWNKGGVPIFFSGSSVRRSYLIAQRVENDPELKLWVVEDNNESQRRLAATIPLKRNGRHLDSALNSWVTIKNGIGRGTDVRASISYVAGGRLHSTEPEYVTEVTSFHVPTNAGNPLVRIERRDGAPTNPWRTIYERQEPARTFVCLRAGKTAVSKC